MTGLADELSRSLLAQGYTLIETHISRVFLHSEQVYKTKRAVSLGFLDFSTLEARKAACEAELKLNARLAPDVYLGLMAVVLRGGSVRFVPAQFAEEDEVLEWAVHMRRLPDEARADWRLSRGLLDGAEIEQIAMLIARFHRSVRADEYTAQFGAPEVLAHNVEENFAQTAESCRSHLNQTELNTIIDYQREFLRKSAPLFEQRKRQGFVRDGHGDLRLEHIYRVEGGDHVIIDCIEFNERFRFADTCADLAFLTMDLKSQGNVELAELLASIYARETGDYVIYSLLDFYESYRAYVRAKVSSMLAQDTQVSRPARRRAHAAARRYFLLALSAAEPPLRPLRVIVSMGMIASGKSTLAAAVAEKLGVPVLAADFTRKELFGVPSQVPLRESAFQGAYSAATSQRVYSVLRERAKLILGSGRSVVLDATFRSREERASVVSLAAEAGADLLFIECQCPRDVALARLRERSHGPHVSDGRAEIYEAFLASFEPPSELPAGAHLSLNTAQPLTQSLDAVLQVLS